MAAAAGSDGAQDVLWALHDFEAEQPDEISFKAGEKIVVVEKDDEFSDGWYTGTNEAGSTGLFPFAYTTTDYSLALQSKLASTHLHSGAEQAASTSAPDGASSSSAAAGAGNAASSPVKKARRNSGDTDNFSIAETDAGAGGPSGTQSEYVPPSGGRAALAASAQRNAAQESASEREAEARRKAAAQQQFEQEEQRQRALLEAAAASSNTPTLGSGGFPRRQESAHASNSLTSISTRTSNNNGAPRTAPVAGMNVHYESEDSEGEDENGFDLSQLKHIHAPILAGTSSLNTPSGSNAARVNGSSTSANLQAAAAAATPSPHKDGAPTSLTSASSAAKLSSPAPISGTAAVPAITTQPSPGQPVPMPVRANSTSSETGTVSQLPSATPSNLPAGDPHDWSVDDVIEWGRGKGWDEATVLSKFREHEISGDVLMEMDVVILKEIDIVAYGKRLKVANAIKELKRHGENAGGAADSSGMTPQTPGSGQNTPGKLHITPRRESLGLGEESEQLRSPLYPPNSGAIGLSGTSSTAPNSATSAQFAPIPAPPGSGGYGGYGQYQQQQQQQAPSSAGPFFTGIGGSAVGSRASITSASGSAGRTQSHSRVESVDRPRSASGISLTGSFGGGNTGSGWPRSGPLELGFTGLGGAPHARAVTDQGGSTNGSARNLLLDGTTATSSTDGGDSNDRGSGNGSGGGGGFLSGLGRGNHNNASSGGGKNARLSKTSDGTASPTSPNLRPGGGGGAAGRTLGHGERSSFFGLGPRNRKPAPKEADSKGGTLSRLGIGKGGSNKQDRTSSYADLKDRISLPTSSPSYEATGDTARRAAGTGAGIGISGAGLSGTGSPLLDPNATMTEKVASPNNGAASTPPSGAAGARSNGGRPGHSKEASVGSVGPEWNGIGTGPTSPLSPSAAADAGPVMARIRPVDYEGWIKKKTERYGTWKPRYMALKGPDLVLLRDPTAEKIKGYVSMKGYKVIADENVNPGRYGFRLIADAEKPHYFSSDDPILVREWMKALMKSTIGRDHSFPVISSYNNATISLKEAQRMNPPPRPPSPTSRARVQRANARPNTQTLSAKDASVLMGLSSPSMPGRM
ncbi:hypothetical protein OC842_005738 [Tilletia horrida]|uniref:Uncharacterized protein n=1 Tax=Tilletia horrida TaxID=155126 RepID=A0AAN6G7E9_9BASI|nr:hypothetical protein OC842_005738 [Tilletia horrida]